ncbi:Oxysterol-binding protein [Lasiosphaeria miniovina]|uniref:Oxysterol-binding protein n=1 Tax=Lasiosphaeria miniovina TaxID=1954250 RepID=A0AA40BIU1_9PEZI|nr:Oxysterol-binding protein [Lasiosphaeria miniovina]KAK0735010.1 Oxysterol-binding protein [Lasiosphaeria miniovina]
MKGLVPGRRRATSNANGTVEILRHKLGGSRSSNDGSQPDTIEEDVTVVETDQGNVLGHIISQLRPGADLSRVVLPTFILEPRSMLERITNFMCHPEMLLPIPKIDDPVQRFVSVVKFYLSGWHIRPPGVKKPLNPILGEIFTCYWDFPDKTRAYYVSEQTSHHPPKSSYFYMVPDHHIRVDGTLKPRSKFLGNSAASLMEGTAILTLLNRGKNPAKGERYILTQPNMYARGILFGKMKYELGDHSFVRCPELGLVADIDFKTKGWVSGTYNAIGGNIKDEKTGEILYELSGLWNEEMFIRDIKTGHKEMFFNALRAKHSPPLCRPLEEQDDRESQKLWAKTAQAVKDRNHELATDEKTKVEDMQREEAAKRAQDGVEWRPRLFRMVRGGPNGPEEGEEDLEWIISAQIDGATPEKQVAQIMAIYPIVKGQKWENPMVIPSRGSMSRPTSSSASVPRKGSFSQGDGDLIDFGQRDSSSTGQKQAPPPLDPSHRSTTEIQTLLSATGRTDAHGGGPLIDFHEDLKSSLPADLKRTDTDESNDEFVDAQG